MFLNRHSNLVPEFQATYTILSPDVARLSTTITNVQVGVFQMSHNGLEPVKDTSTMFLSNQEFAGDASTGLTVMLEGTRPMMVEVQALCVRSEQVCVSRNAFRF